MEEETEAHAELGRTVKGDIRAPLIIRLSQEVSPLMSLTDHQGHMHPQGEGEGQGYK